MTVKPTIFAAAIVATLLLPAVTPPNSAFAQSAAGVTETPPAGPSAAPRPKTAARKSESVSERVEQHIARLHSQLRITPAQQGEWDQFAQVMRDNAKDMNHALEQRGATFASMNAAENMQSYARIAQQHAQDTQKLAAAFQTLYETMSDAQKKNADTIFQARGDHPLHKKG